MQQIICDYCGKVINELFEDYRGDLDSSNLATLDIKVWLNKTKEELKPFSEIIDNADLCRECIIKVLKG